MLVSTLAHANGWHRLTAQRLLLERQDAAAVPLLEKMALENESPLARLHALWTLENLSALQPRQVTAALKDQDPQVRRHAIRLAEAFLPGLSPAVLAMADDPDPKVQFQLLLTLGEIPETQNAIARIVAAHAGDTWFRAAALLSVRDRPLPVLTSLLNRHREFFDNPPAESAAKDSPSEGRQAFLRGLASILGARRNPAELGLFLITLEGSRPLQPAPWRSALLSGLGDGLAIDAARGLQVPSAAQVLGRFLNDPSEQVRDAAFEAATYFYLPGMVRDALAAAASEDISVDRRERAVRFLRGGEFKAVSGPLGRS